MFRKTEKANIDLIKKKQYVFIKNFTNKEVFSKDFVNIIDDHFKAIRPFFDYMTYILTTDLKPKLAMEECNIGNTKVKIYGLAKGSGMIFPNMGLSLIHI